MPEEILELDYKQPQKKFQVGDVVQYMGDGRIYVVKCIGSHDHKGMLAIDNRGMTIWVYTKQLDLQCRPNDIMGPPPPPAHYNMEYEEYMTRLKAIAEWRRQQTLAELHRERAGFFLD